MRLTKALLSLVCLSLIAIGFSTCEEPEKPKPEITAVFPTEATVGESVVISGKNFAAATDVLFGLVSAGIVSKTDEEILTVVPSSLVPGATIIIVKAEERVSNEMAFSVLESVPEISSLEPAKGSSGMEVVIKGKYFGTISSVSFGDTDVTSFVSKTDAEVKVIVPPALAHGVLDVTVTTNGGTSEKSTFTVIGKPEITSILPIIGPIGKVVTIKGKFFEETSKVFVGEGLATFEVKSAILIEATVPATATTGKVKVITPGGEAISADNYTIKDAPQITNFTPTSGIVGAVITINGTNFDAGSLVVKFGSGNATNVTLVSAQKITAKVSAAATTGKITVTTAAGTTTSANVFTVIGAPVITSVSPESGLIGADIVINGKDFTGVTEVKFNDTAVPAANYTVVSALQIKAKVPTGASSGKISVKAAGGTALSPNSFTVLVPPVVTSFTPDKIVRDGEVVVTGTGFTNITSVKIGGVDIGSNYTVTSSTKITLKVVKAAVTGKITITNASGSSTSTNTLGIFPYMDKVDPITGAPGTVLTIDGTNMLGSKVKFNSTEVTPTSNSATQIKVTVPASLNGAVNVTVANTVGTSNSKPFTATIPAVLTEVVSVANIKGELILLSGTDLAGATKVWFGNTPATVLTSTARVVTAKIPTTLGLGTYDVKVETPKGNTNTKSFEVINVQPPPTGGINLSTGVGVTSLPPGYVPPISNLWNNDHSLGGSENILIAQGSNNTLTVELRIGANTPVVGEGLYDLSAENGVLDNYIEFTVNGVRYVGTWQAPEYNDTLKKYCYHNMLLISTESGKVLKLRIYNFECDN